MNALTKMLPIDLQTSVEYKYSRKHIDRSIRKEIRESDALQDKVAQGIQLLKDWLVQPTYASKAKRLAQINEDHLEELVIQVFTGTSYIQEPLLFTAVSSQLASRLHFSDRREGIQTMAEILAVLCPLDVYDILKTSAQGSLMLQSRLVFSDQLMEYIAQSIFLPPMLCEPLEVTDNRQSGYLTHNESLILKAHNHHDDDICLDVINLQNRIPLSLDEEFIRTVEEPPPSDLNDVEDPHLKNPVEIREEIRLKTQQWEAFKNQSIKVYALMIGHGNRFWLTNQVDKRGRLYPKGYHVTTQGTKYKKAIVELADKELVHGVPS